eukprot:352058-Chlamydomonas_euryale.AAC.8
MRSAASASASPIGAMPRKAAVAATCASGAACDGRCGPAMLKREAAGVRSGVLCWLFGLPLGGMGGEGRKGEGTGVLRWLFGLPLGGMGGEGRKGEGTAGEGR